MNSLKNIIISDVDAKRKKELEQSISRKRMKLTRLQANHLRLNIQLNTIQKDYENRIGKLFAKDNALDLEIIRYKNITKLLENGLSFDEATKEINELYQSFFSYTPDENESQFYEFLHYNPGKAESLSDSVKENLKNLWKKLLFQFHPDLVKNPIEKQKREDIMKKINKAYKEKNLEGLKMLESTYYIEEFKSGTVDQLELVLVEIENVIIILERQLRRLKTSEWYTWKIQLQKAQKNNKDIFADLEKSLLDDIISKTKILNELKDMTGYIPSDPATNL